MLDWFAAGAPAALAAKMSGVPYVARVGGDYLWEQRYLEGGNPPLTLLDFYNKGLQKRYPISFHLIRWVLKNSAHVIFNSDKQRKIYEENYELSSTSTICNPVPDMGDIHRYVSSRNKEFVFWGRFIVMKNLDNLVRAFAKARIPAAYSLTLIGNGPRKMQLKSIISELGVENRVKIMNSMRDKVFNRVKNCRALIITSWTDISPNAVYQALALGLPALVTKENYLSIHDQLPEMVDPYSVDDIASKIEILADDARYADFSERFNAISFKNDWNAVLKQHIALFKRILTV